MKDLTTLKTTLQYLQENGINKNFTVGELKKFLNRIPDDYVVCKSLIDGDSVEYSSIEVITVMQKQEFIDFKGDEIEGNIITIY